MRPDALKKSTDPMQFLTSRDPLVSPPNFIHEIQRIILTVYLRNYSREGWYTRPATQCTTQRLLRNSAPDLGKMEIYFFDATKDLCNTVNREVVHWIKGILFGDTTKKLCNTVMKK